MKKAFWGLFIAWNVLILYIVSGKQEAKKIDENTQNTQLVNKNIQQTSSKKIAVSKYNYINTELETDVAKFKFLNNKLNCVELKKYTEHDKKIAKTILKDESIEVVWSNQAPDINAKWSIKKQNNTVIMQHTNKNNITFIQQWTIDKYSINVATKVLNNSAHTIKTQASLIANKKAFEKHQSFIFSGISICADKKIKNFKLGKINNANAMNAQTGWCAFNEKYWLVAAISKNATQFNAQETKSNETISYQIRAINQEQEIHAKSSAQNTFDLYTGPKELKELQHFGTQTNTRNIENIIDYGWLFFMTKPVHYVLDLLIENLGVIFALILLTLILKLMTWPFTTSSHRSAQRMHAISPQINELRARYKETPAVMNKEIHALYKKHGINPLGGCLPSFVQMIMVFPLYKVLSFNINLYGASFPFWIKDLSMPDPTSFFNLFGLLPFAAPDFLHIGLWPVLMGVTSIVQQKLSSAPIPDEQKMMMYMLPVLFTWIMASLPAGVVIYWTLTNAFTIAQIMWINYTDKDIQKVRKK